MNENKIISVSNCWIKIESKLRNQIEFRIKLMKYLIIYIF